MQNQFKSNLLEFFSLESPRELKRLAWLSFFVGATNTVLIALINTSAGQVAAGETLTWQFFLFAALLAIFLLVTKRANEENIRNSQELIHRFKMRTMHNILRTNLAQIDVVGRAEILQILAKDTQAVSQSVGALVSVAQSGATLVCLTLYMATISFVAFGLTVVSCVLVIVLGARQLLSMTKEFVDVSNEDAVGHRLFEDFLNGYKEIKMNSHRASDFARTMVQSSKHATTMRVEFLTNATNFFNYLTLMMYAIVGILIFVVPVVSSDFAVHVTQTTTTALFLASSLTGLITNTPTISLSNISAGILLDLERRLSISNSAGSDAVKVNQQSFENVRKIEVDGLLYQHLTSHSGRPFVLGPISYQFEVGKVYFIRGNNGSGKTTLMRLLTGLYQPTSGSLIVNDDQEVVQPASHHYRDLFAVVFSDFYLFKKLYGLADYSQKEIDELLGVFKMQGKLSVEHGEFSDLSFSTGQRKRIALIVALLEKRPFLILDEWAADQDPEFRQEFYEHIIPMFREMGKGVVAITHDDQYYNTADQVLYLSNGKPIAEL
jgi:putative ATP-binding cassette transporter